MSQTASGPSMWSGDCTAVVTALSATSKQLSQLAIDPFTALKEIDKARDILARAGFGQHDLIERTRQKIADECVRLEAEFWGLFSDACADEGWSLIGNTNRRLVSKAVFVSLETHSVSIEGASKVPPFVPSLLNVLSAELKTIATSTTELASFLVSVARAHDDLAHSGGGLSIEGIYRQCVLNGQSNAFWRSPTAKAFIPLSRSAFMYRLSEVIRLGMSTPDGRSVHLGTTTSSNEAWEIYSPGEERVVLVGRLQMASAGGPQ